MDTWTAKLGIYVHGLLDLIKINWLLNDGDLRGFSHRAPAILHPTKSRPWKLSRYLLRSLAAERGGVVSSALEIVADGKDGDGGGQALVVSTGVGDGTARAAGEGLLDPLDIPTTDSVASVGGGVEPLAGDEAAVAANDATEAPDLTLPDGFVNLGEGDDILSFAFDDLARDDVEFTTGLVASADEEGAVGRLLDGEGDFFLRVIRVAKGAGPSTNKHCEDRTD